MVKTGILGCGNICGAVIEAIVSGKIEAQLVAIVDLQLIDSARRILELSAGKIKYYRDPLELVDLDIDVVFEAANPAVVQEYALPLIKSGKDLILMSIGGLVDANLLEHLRQAARDAGKKIILPAGAISGISTLKAASLCGELDEVIIKTTKAPRGLAGAPLLANNAIDIGTFQEKTLIFEGNVVEAIAGFPRNVNVAAAVALAGLGPKLTRVEIYADPNTERTQHNVVARGGFGELQLSLRVFPNPNNPKSSYLATLGAISAFKQYTQEIIMGL